MDTLARIAEIRRQVEQGENGVALFRALSQKERNAIMGAGGHCLEYFPNYGFPRLQCAGCGAVAVELDPHIAEQPEALRRVCPKRSTHPPASRQTAGAT